jgi:hypothetical protein
MYRLQLRQDLTNTIVINTNKRQHQTLLLKVVTPMQRNTHHNFFLFLINRHNASPITSHLLNCASFNRRLTPIANFRTRPEQVRSYCRAGSRAKHLQHSSRIINLAVPFHHKSNTRIHTAANKGINVALVSHSPPFTPQPFAQHTTHSVKQSSQCRAYPASSSASSSESFLSPLTNSGTLKNNKLERGPSLLLTFTHPLSSLYTHSFSHTFTLTHTHSHTHFLKLAPTNSAPTSTLSSRNCRRRSPTWRTIRRYVCVRVFVCVRVCTCVYFVRLFVSASAGCSLASQHFTQNACYASYIVSIIIRMLRFSLRCARVRCCRLRKH